MPGNEVGDRVHNFFGHDNLPQGQHHPQAVDGNWSGVSNNIWAGSQRQVGAPVNSSLKNYNVQQPDSERGHGSPSLHVPHGLSFVQSNLRPEFGREPEFGRVQSQNQHSNLNGYVHGHQMFQTRQNEANFLGVDRESDRQNLTSRGFSILESQRGSGHEHKNNSMRLETSESPIGFDFFGGQQQMSGPDLSTMQSLQRQQSGISDMQQLQQQVMYTQFQEFQRQQQLQQLGRQQVLANQVSSMAKQAAGNHSPAFINGVPINEASNNQWPPDLVSGNTNWLQHGASPVMQGASSGHVLSPEQAHALRMMGFVPQQADQSLYGVPVTSTSGSPGSYSHIQMEKTPMQQVSTANSSFSGNNAGFSGEVSMQDGSLNSRQDFQGRSMFRPSAAEVSNSGFSLDNINHVNSQQRNEPMQEFQGRRLLDGLSQPSQEKSVIQAEPSQSAATLDPTEEKILFGSDDNLWDAFGRSSNVGMSGSNMSDGMDVFGGISSLQSGTWSALMQSAVAETSSADIGQQEEWCPPSFQNQGPPAGNQQPTGAGDTGKQQPSWGGSNLHSSSDLNSRPSPQSTDAHRPNTNTSFSSIQGFQNDSSQRFVQQIPEEGSKWLDRSPIQKPPAEGSHSYGNITRSLGTEMNANKVSGSWNRQQSITAHNSDGQPLFNGWNFNDSISTEGANNQKSHGSKSLLRSAPGGDGWRGAHEKMGNDAGIWTDSVPNSNAEMEHAKYPTGNPQMNREGLSTSNSRSNSMTARANHDSLKQPTNNHEFWKAVDFSVNANGNEVLGKNQHQLDKSLLILESSGNNCLDKGVKMQDMETSKKENSSSFCMKESVTSDSGDSRGFTGSKQKTSNNSGQRPPGSRKFLYHPMGDVDIEVEPSYGRKHDRNSETIPQKASQVKSHEQESVGFPKSIGHSNSSSMEMQKADTKRLDEKPSQSMLPGFLPKKSTPFDRFPGTNAPNQAASSSQHMLDLLHKVDQPREGGNTRHFSSSDHNTSSEIPEMETSDGSVGHIQRNQSSVPQGFGLQLAPPSQRGPIPDHASPSQISSQAVFNSSAVHPEIGEKGHTWMASAAAAQSLPSSREASQVEFRNNLSGTSGHVGNTASQYNIQGGFPTAFKSGFPYSSQRKNQPIGATGQVTASQSMNIPSDRLAFHAKQMVDSREKAQSSQSPMPSVPDMSENVLQNNFASAEASPMNAADQSRLRVPALKVSESDALPLSEPCVTSGIPHQGVVPKVPSNDWTSVPFQQPSLNSDPSSGASTLFESQLQTNNNLVATFPGSPKFNELDSRERGSGLSAFGVYSSNMQSFVEKEQPAKQSTGQQVSFENIQNTQKINVSQGVESIANNVLEASSTSVATQRDIEAFGRSLRPNNSLLGHSMLDQGHTIRSIEVDGSDPRVKRLKGSDSGAETQQVGSQGGSQLSSGHNNIARDSAADRTSIPSGDSKMLSFSSKLGDTRNPNPSSQDNYAFSQKNSQAFSSSTNASPFRGEPPQVSPQMAPSWFAKYGTFRTGQMLPVHDTFGSALKSFEQPTIAGKPGDNLHLQDSMEQSSVSSDATKFVSIPQSSVPFPSEQSSSPRAVAPDVTTESLVVRPKKRKSDTSELSPWHNELTMLSQRLLSISVAEADWAQATNRLAEKVEDETESFEDGLRVLRPRRRLVLTTQLIQQLLRPPSAAILSADASSCCESVAYFSSRLALGDACSAISRSGSDTQTPSPLDSVNLVPEKAKTPERNSHQHFSKVVEDLVDKARKLESDLLRLDKRTSILDLRVESQDLEKFSVINRFAKFHGRAQGDGAEPSSSSDLANAQKSCPQKYVTALPVPRNLPDRVQCFSL